MNIDPEPFDEILDPSAARIGLPDASGFCSISPGSDPTNSAKNGITSSTSGMEQISPGTNRDILQTFTDMNQQNQALTRLLEEERSQFANERQQLSNEIQRLNLENQQLNRQAADVAQVNQKLLALNQFGIGLKNGPDVEITSQLMAKLLQKIYAADCVCVFSFKRPELPFLLQAAAGPLAYAAPSHFSPDPDQPLIGEVMQSLRPAFSTSTTMLDDLINVNELSLPAVLAAPVTRDQNLFGLILIAGQSNELFTAQDLPVIETAAWQLLNTWEYAQKSERLTEFVQAATSLSIIQETGSLMQMIASLARRTLSASFTMVAALNQQEWLMRSSGKAPQIFASLQNGAAGFLDEAIKSPYTFRLRDLRQDERAALIQIDSPELCSLLASPIRINGTVTGVLLAFGKHGEVAFPDSDVFLAELLVSQAAVNLESCYLNQELRNTLKTTKLLYDLSQDISQAEDLENAARAIARTAFQLLQARHGGMILFTSNGRKKIEVRFPQNDDAPPHPYSLIQQAMDSRQTIYFSESETQSRVVIPIQTMRRCYGALWLELSEDPEETRHPTDEIRILINQAAVALERSILLEETRQKTVELSKSNQQLIESYDQLLDALMRALDARDSETEGHSGRVKRMATELGKEIGLSKTELKYLEHGSLLHDIGKIGIRDSVLLKPGPLDYQEWQIMRKHPQIGARIIQEIPALHNALPVIAFHQERWDGSGYPLRLSGAEIPLLARIFAVVDVFDALTSDRPYRTKLSDAEALDYLHSQAGILFDPEITAKFIAMIQKAQS